MADSFAPAKVNLTLHVTGQRADGYHLLDSLVVFADVGDRVQVVPAPDLTLRVTGPMAAGVPLDDSNLVLRAARLMDVRGAITLDKHLPAAAGIGGGSSDAAATLRALSELTGVPIPDALSLGADVPVCLAATPTRMAGIGDELTPIHGWPDLHAVLVNPRLSVPTLQVFKGLARRDNVLMADSPSFTDASDCIDWLAAQRNDLERPAMAICPAISNVLAALDRSGARLRRMSGSGATSFGLFSDAPAAQTAAEAIAQAHPNWWVTQTTLGGAR